ncbi:hypothetical protein [uncultured Arcobacter sp.]|uniref:hypothetical protein n=1 Tax=uncultured Arcobacter sp. TaxID=165434 RepID=UPI002613CC09|nr:hypothetical protein [uncultured Arcobacter sp.]
MIWNKKTKNGKSSDSIVKNGKIIMQKTLSECYDRINAMSTVKINIVAVGNDGFGSHMQIWCRNFKHPEEISSWAEKAVTKLKTLSTVNIDVSGDDLDGDYVSHTFKFDKDIGKIFLDYAIPEAIDSSSDFYNSMNGILMIESK